MIYRTAQRATYRNLNNNLGMLSYRIAELTSKIASERRINTPSDDPSGAASVLGTRSTLASIKQYTTNIGVSDLWLNDSGNAIQSIKETLDEIYAKTEQGATDTYSATQRQVIADEVRLLFQSIVQFGDTKIGDSYIFAGQKITTQPFGLQVEAQKVVAGCQNSDKWTGKIQNYGDAAFNNRSDLPVHSQDFLIEVVRAGGVDSRYYTNTDPNFSARIQGDDYGFKFKATDPRYNNTQVKFAAGPEPRTTTGAGNGQLTWGGTTSPTKIVYTYGSTAGTTVSWNDADHTLTVALQTNSSGASVATARDVTVALNAAQLSTPTGSDPLPAWPTLSAAAGGDGSGRVDPLIDMGGKSFFGYNYGTYAEVKGDNVTVYLQRDNATGKLVADADAVKAAIDQAAGGRITTEVTGDGTALVQPTPTSTTLATGEPYTLAHATISPKGTQNDLEWSVKNFSSYIGEAGNKLSVAYNVPENPFVSTPSITFDEATGQVTVNLAVSGGVYYDTYVKLYNSPNSGAFKDAEKANEMALAAAIQTTAKDVMALAEKCTYTDGAGNQQKLSGLIDVKLADGNSGEGQVNRVERTNLSDGFDQPALFRVSQDGGKTWGPPMSFAASEYETGDMFHNAYLGHASMTTGLAGKANDLVFTATHQGTWGNDLRVEYKLPKDKPSADMSVEVGPNPWNICVTLAVDGEGKVLTTANQVMEAINNHPVASQLVTADLANYHEGGNGRVDVMACKALTVGEPYQVNGKSVITPLGYATADVKFDYVAPAQKDPNIIFQALQQGPDGNSIGVRYTTSADPTYYTDPAKANESYQDMTTVRYETTADGKKILVVHLATEPLPSCPDDTENPEASAKWKELYPVYSCTTDRAVISNAGDVVQAIIDKNTGDPENAIVWPQLERWPDGLDSTAKVGPTNGTVWLTGGNDTDDASKHGVNLRFIPDGTALQVGDVFEVPVGWYRGDDKNMDINASPDYRTTLNIPGGDVLGGNGAGDNILDTVQRIIWALEHNDSELVGKELPKIKASIEKVTTLETQIGTRQIRNQFLTRNLDQSKYSAENFLSQVEDADFSQLITDLKNAQTVYEACLGATGLTHKVSLLNYI